MTGKKDTTGDGETPTRTKNFFESSVANSTGMVVAVVAQRFRHVFADSWRTRDDHTRVRGSWQTSHWDATVDFDGKRSSNDGLTSNKHLHSQRHKKEWPSIWQEEQRRRGSSRNVHFVFEHTLNTTDQRLCHDALEAGKRGRRWCHGSKRGRISVILCVVLRQSLPLTPSSSGASSAGGSSSCCW